MNRIALVRFVLLGLLALACGAIALRAYWLERIDAANLRLDPNGLNAYLESSRPQTAARVLVLFGDSRARDWPDPMLPNTLAINRGVNGQSSAQIAARLQKHVLSLQPDVVVIQAGVNDLRQIAQFPESEADITRRCIENLRASVITLRARNVTVVLTTVFPASPYPSMRIFGWSDRVDSAIATVNTALRDMAAADPGIVLLDAAAQLSENGVVKRTYARDMLHLNATGYAVLNAVLRDHLQR